MATSLTTDAPSGSAEPGIADRTWWAITAGVAGLVGSTWWSLMFLPLGDSHDGRIMGRFGLHVRNLWERGLVDSGFLTDLSPFPTETYAHHPPLMNALHGVVSAVFGQGEWQLRSIGFASGVLTVITLVWLLRTLGIRWPVAVAAVMLTASTPMFWIYARLGAGVWIPIVVAVVVVRATDGIDDRGVAGIGVVGALVSWQGVAIVALGAVHLWRRSRVESARRLAVGGLAGLAVTVLWILSATDVAELAEHTSRRVEAAGITAADYVDQMWFFYSNLFPMWYLAVMIPALGAGLASKRARPVVGVFLLVTVVWTAALPEASFIHDYWTFALLVPFTVGLGVIGNLLSDADTRLAWAMMSVAGLVLAGWLVGGWRADIRTAYFDEPSAAGQLLQDVGPAPGQDTGWVVGAIALPRWMSWYWGVPVHELGPETLRSIGPDDLVLIRYDRVPDWLDRDRLPTPRGQEGRYALLDASELEPAIRSG